LTYLVLTLLLQSSIAFLRLANLLLTLLLGTRSLLFLAFDIAKSLRGLLLALSLLLRALLTQLSVLLGALASLNFLLLATLGFFRALLDLDLLFASTPRPSSWGRLLSRRRRLSGLNRRLPVVVTATAALSFWLWLWLLGLLAFIVSTPAPTLSVGKISRAQQSGGDRCRNCQLS
jgi:hypothetical protein